MEKHLVEFVSHKSLTLHTVARELSSPSAEVKFMNFLELTPSTKEKGSNSLNSKLVLKIHPGVGNCSGWRDMVPLWDWSWEDGAITQVAWVKICSTQRKLNVSLLGEKSAVYYTVYPNDLHTEGLFVCKNDPLLVQNVAKLWCSWRPGIHSFLKSNWIHNIL